MPSAALPRVPTAVLVAALVSLAASSRAQPPDPAATMWRDAEGRVTIRAVRLTGPLTIDGRLDEEIYQTVRPTGEFTQQEPRSGEPSTERTETWVLFDDTNIYVSARCWDSHPEREIANELRRDSTNITQNENFAVVFDTFLDRRNGFYFQTTPLGAMRDQSITDEGNFNTDWNTIWETRASRSDQGWTFEMEIPFKSIRYAGSGPQTWGINMRRVVRWKNEQSYISPVPQSYGQFAIFRFSAAGTLVGVETPSRSLNLELKPYVISTVTTDRAAASPYENDLKGNAGFDFKYGLTRAMTADFTYRTDFAQVEDDLQQVNLTRFSLFFPEKRDFFLEGQGVFTFGAATRSEGEGGGDSGDVPVFFFSRRIGLSNSQPVPVVAGGRLTGKAGRFGIGALSIQTGDKASAGAEATNFSVLRIKRDILRRSHIGLILSRRSPALGADGANSTYGLDGNFLFFQNVAVSGYYARTTRPDGRGDESSYRGRFDYTGDRYGFLTEHLLVGDEFDPQIGFVQRHDFRRTSAQARFSPRPKSIKAVRKFTWLASMDYVTDGAATALESRELAGTFRTEFNNSDTVNVTYQRNYEAIDRPFNVAGGGLVPIGAYSFQSARMQYRPGQQRKMSGTLTLGRGSFYGGTRTEAGYSGRIEVTPRLAVESGLSFNWIALPNAEFVTRLMSARAIFAPGPRMMMSGLFQYNSSANAFNSNVRLRWEYIPGSELFVVYSDGRDTSFTGFPPVQNRTVAVKATRLLRF